MSKDTILKNGQSPDASALIAIETSLVLSDKLNTHISQIRNELRDLTGSFFRLGYHLFELKENWSDELLKKDFYSFCSEQFNLQTTSIKNFINVYKAFKSKDDPEMIDEKFENTSFSALVELLPIKDDKEVASQIKMLPTRQIREIVKVYDVDSSCRKDLFNRVFDLIISLLKSKGVQVKGDVDEEGNKHIVINDTKDLTYSFSMNSFVLDGFNTFDLYRWYNSIDYSHFNIRFGLSDLNDAITKIIEDVKKYQFALEEKNKVVESDDCDVDEEDFVATGWAKKLGLNSEDEISDFCNDVRNYKRILDSDELKLRLYVLDPVDYPDLKKEIKLFFFAYAESDDELYKDDLDNMFTLGRYGFEEVRYWEITDMFLNEDVEKEKE